MSYITLQQLKNYLGSKNSVLLLDDNLSEIILSSNSKINSDLTIQVTEEKISYIDDIKTNKVDGSNKKFYVRNFFNKYFGDSNDDGAITKDDVEIIAKYSNGTKAILPVTSIDVADMGFTLTSAPASGTELYVTYKYSYFDMYTPDQRIKDLARYLCLMKCYFELEIGLIGTTARAGNISLSGIDKNNKSMKYKSLSEELFRDLKMASNSKSKAVPIDISKLPRYRRENYLSIPGKEVE